MWDALKRAENAIHGWADEPLTFGLLLLAAVLVLVALQGPTLLKGLVLAWALLP